jgi:mono/diheme cytochrome c family protein
MRRVSVALALLFSSLGCWEQLDDGKWFPQMKRQKAVQAFEEHLLYQTETGGQLQGFTPPEGTVPVSYAGVPDLRSLSMADQDAVQNPVAPTLASLARGKQLYDRTCTTCHGAEGKGDGPVAGPPFGTGPFGLVLPIGGPTSLARALTDGHIYTTISLGRGRMPSYSRISPEDRWNVVNYVRELNGGRQ